MGRWTLSGSWARRANKPSAVLCWLMHNLLVVLPHSPVVLLLPWKKKSTCEKCCPSCTIRAVECREWKMVLALLEYSCLGLMHVLFPLWLWKCLSKHCLCVCVWSFYVYCLIQLCAENLQLRQSMCVYACVYTRARILPFSPPPSLPCKADREHTKFIQGQGNAFLSSVNHFGKMSLWTELP